MISQFERLASEAHVNLSQRFIVSQIVASFERLWDGGLNLTVIGEVDKDSLNVYGELIVQSFSQAVVDEYLILSVPLSSFSYVDDWDTLLNVVNSMAEAHAVTDLIVDTPSTLFEQIFIEEIRRENQDWVENHALYDHPLHPVNVHAVRELPASMRGCALILHANKYTRCVERSYRAFASAFLRKVLREELDYSSNVFSDMVTCYVVDVFRSITPDSNSFERWKNKVSEALFSTSKKTSVLYAVMREGHADPVSVHRREIDARREAEVRHVQSMVGGRKRDDVSYYVTSFRRV